MSTPAPISQDTPALRGTARGHILKKTLPLNSKPEDGWKTLEDGETWIEMTPDSCYMVIDSDPFGGDDLILAVFEESGELKGPLQFRPAPEHSAKNLISAAKWKKRRNTFLGLLVALAWMASTAYYAVTWMMDDSYLWTTAGFIMGLFSAFQIRTAVLGLFEMVDDLFRTNLPASVPLVVTMAQAESAQEAA